MSICQGCVERDEIIARLERAAARLEQQVKDMRLEVKDLEQDARRAIAEARWEAQQDARRGEW